MKVYKGILILSMVILFGFVPLHQVLYKQAPEYHVSDQTVGADGVDTPIAPMEQDNTDIDFDFKNAAVGGVFGYLLTNALDLTKKLIGMIAMIFTRRKK